jgi:hypothetical protein
MFYDIDAYPTFEHVGLGLFEVDRELMLITKQRIIDSGVGSDLVRNWFFPLTSHPVSG